MSEHIEQDKLQHIRELKAKAKLSNKYYIESGLVQLEENKGAVGVGDGVKTFSQHFLCRNERN